MRYNRLEWMEIYVALAKAGLIAVPINFRLVGPEIRYIAEHCGARAFIVEGRLIDSVEGTASLLPITASGWIRIGVGARAGMDRLRGVDRLRPGFRPGM